MRRHAARTTVSHPSARLISMLWIAVGIAMTIAFFAGTWSGAVRPVSIPGLASVLIGVSAFMNGALARLLRLRNLAFVWWAGAGLMLYWPGLHVFAIFGMMMFALYVIPGFALNAIARRAGAAV